MWKKIHVELEFLRLEFHHFIFLLLPRVLQTQGSSSCKSECPIVQSELQRSMFFLCSSFLFKSVLRQIILPVLLQVYVQSSNRSSNILRSRSSSIHHSSPLFLFFVKSFFMFFFKSVFLQVPKSSLRNSVLLFRTRVYKTRDLSAIIFPTHQMGIKSLTLKF